LFFLSGAELNATRPSPSEIAEHRCPSVLFSLGQAIDHLTQEQMVNMTGKRKGVFLVDGKILSFLMKHDEHASTNRMYENIMFMETSASQCHYYCVFNLDSPVDGNYMFLFDTKHGFNYNSARTGTVSSKPRERFKEVCAKFKLENACEKFAGEFAEETEKTKKLKTAKAKDDPFINALVRYWYVVLLLVIVEFFLTDMRFLKNHKWQLQLYLLGLNLACVIGVLSITTIFYTGTPLPGWRSFSHLIKGSYPAELHFISDLILFSSFAWWVISLIAVFFGGKFQLSPIIPLLYLVLAPLSLAMSESPFGGFQKMAFPFAMVAIALFSSIYCYFKYRTKPTK
jgi:hypothetical protein